MDKVSVLNNPIPIKSIPEQELNRIIIEEFSVWVSSLLSLTGETSLERLKIALPAIKQHCWSLGLSEIKKMFEMYADGQLKTQPRSNYFDRVLVGQIFNDYKSQKMTKPVKKDIDQEKAKKDYIDCITWFDWYIQHRKVPIEMTWLYDYLDQKKLLNFTPKEKRLMMGLAEQQLMPNPELYKDNPEKKKEILDECKRKSKRTLLGRYFDKLQAKGTHLKELI